MITRLATLISIGWSCRSGGMSMGGDGARALRFTISPRSSRFFIQREFASRSASKAALEVSRARVARLIFRLPYASPSAPDGADGLILTRRRLRWLACQGAVGRRWLQEMSLGPGDSPPRTQSYI